MAVTKIEPLTKIKYKVYLDGEFAFVLYKGELSRLSYSGRRHFERRISDRILQMMICKRAKLRAMHLLTDMGRTESISGEAASGMVSAEDSSGGRRCVCEVLSVYLDDVEYARSFIESRKASRAEKELYAALARKAYQKEIASRSLKKCYGNGMRRRQSKRLCEKKLWIRGRQTGANAKIIGYLVRKGFRYEDIRQVIQNYDENA